MKVKDAKMLDIENPDVAVEVSIRADGQVLWVNVDGRCLLRICRLGSSPIIVTDERKPDDSKLEATYTRQ